MSLGTNLDNKDRAPIIEFIIKKANKYKYKQSTLHGAVAIFDRYLSLVHVEISDIKNLKGIAIVSLFLSAKMEETIMIRVNDFVKDGIYDKDFILEMEQNIINKLNYCIYYDTIYHYINAYDKKLIYKNYLLASGLATILLTTKDYTYVVPKILAKKIINFTNLLDMDKNIIETAINSDIFYIFIYLSWKSYSSYGYVVRDYYLSCIKYDIFSIKIPEIKCIYEINNFILAEHYEQTPMDINNDVCQYSKEMFEQREVVKKLGDGTFGSVKSVKINNKNIALKKIKYEQESYGFDFYSLRELNALFRLRHQNITNIDGFYYDPKKMALYIGMDLMDMTLSKRIKYYVNDDDLKFSYIKQLLTGLEYIHGQNIIHRDLSANNILISNNGELKISDFGSSRYFRHESYLEKYTDEICTLFYRPIEILLGKDMYNYKMDIWSCACIIYYILMGKHIFKADSEIDMITNIFEVLGTPTDMYYPDLRDFPNFRNSLAIYPKIGLVNLEKKYPKQTNLLYLMFDYYEKNRINATEALSLFMESI